MTDNQERLAFDFQYRDVSVAFFLPSKDDHISKVLMSTGSFYELPMLEAIAPELRPGDLVVDAGANIGNHTLFFAKVLGCRVLAFEAIPATAALLEQNVALNGLSDQVHVHAVALGEKSGKARLTKYDPSNIGGATLVPDRRGDIPVRLLDEVPREGPVRLLKIDVEGMDLAVLRGSRTILSKDRPWVVCEAGDDALYRPIAEFMDRMGYSPTAVYNATDTYLFLPSRSEGERQRLMTRAFVQMMAMQREEKRIAASLAQAGRYSERMKREALAEVEVRLETLRKEHAKSKQESIANATAALRIELDAARAAIIAERDQAQARLELAEQQNSLKLVAIERQLDAKSADLDEARATLHVEREQAAAQLADAQRRAGEGRAEIAALLERAAQARQMLEQQRVSFAGLTATLAREQAAHQAQIKQLRADNERAVEAMAKQVRELSARLVKRDGRLARSERELAERQRRIADAHRVLRLERQSLAIANDALYKLQTSISLRLGVLIVGSMRSPLRTVALLWNVPALLWREWRRKADSDTSPGGKS